MTKIDIDKEKVARMVKATLHGFHGSGAHPAEIVLALAECIGRVVASLPGSEVPKRELVDLAIKHMAGTIMEGIPKVIQ
jgi:hypothetical protein